MAEEQTKKIEVTAKDELSFTYFEHNKTIAQVLSLFCGFLFTSITILLTSLKNPGEVTSQVTLLFLTIVFYLSLFVLVDNLEMPFHYIGKIPAMTLKIRPFFFLLVIFYLFGAANVMMFSLFNLASLTIISGVLWLIIVIISILTTGRRFFNQAKKRDWGSDTLR
jgi:hypothetical protein